MRCYLIRDEDHHVVRITGTNTNISDLVARENEVTELNKKLEMKVKQRTEDLEAAVILAEKANASKSIFLSKTVYIKVYLKVRSPPKMDQSTVKIGIQ